MEEIIDLNEGSKIYVSRVNTTPERVIYFEEGMVIYSKLLDTHKEIKKKAIEVIDLTSCSLSNIEARLAKRKAELQVESAQMGKNDTERRALLDQALTNDDTYTDLLSDKCAEEACRDRLEAEISELHGMASAYKHALNLYEAYLRSRED